MILPPFDRTQPTGAMKPIDTPSKIRILRQMIEVIMWQWNAVKEGRWEELPAYDARKRDILQEMSGYDWTGGQPREREDTELLILESQIIDLEYQFKKMLEHRMNVIAVQLEDLQRRHNNWQKAVNPYRAAAATMLES
ncbi:MAG: hypothetical protein PW734_00735 [Verrucomicrobium sp.]|nr:hypothetical protein [Verrucomicrobium sp.]